MNTWISSIIIVLLLLIVTAWLKWFISYLVASIHVVARDFILYPEDCWRTYLFMDGFHSRRFTLFSHLLRCVALSNLWMCVIVTCMCFGCSQYAEPEVMTSYRVSSFMLEPAHTNVCSYYCVCSYLCNAQNCVCSHLCMLILNICSYWCMLILNICSYLCMLVLMYAHT